MQRTAGTTDQAPAPAGAYSQSVRCGSVVWAAGQGGFHPDGSGLVGSDTAAQTRQALANVVAVLEASGASRDDIVRVGVFLTDPADFGEMNDAYAAFFGGLDPLPARTTVSVGLPAGMKVEIDAMAVIEG